MKKVSKEIRSLFNEATPEERRFLRGIPSLDNIEKKVENFNKFIKTNKITGRRVGMGEVGMIGKKVAGYHTFTVMNDANATPYERKFMDMGSKLNYVHSKKLFIHPEYRGRGVATKLVRNALGIAKKLQKQCIFDVEESNYHMANILSRCEFQSDFNWTTPKKIEMTRFCHE